MTLVPVLLFLAAVLPPSLLNDNYENDDLADLSTTKTSIQEEIVNKHNQLRRMVSPPGSDLLKMQWDDDAQVNAQRWASQCTYKHSSQELRTIRNKMKCGENIFMANYPASWSQAIQDWYDESQDMIYGVGPKASDKVVGHYTQVVWNSTYRVGCGLAECPGRSMNYLYVCHYCPAGNYVSRMYNPYTVGEPCASCPDYCEDRLCTNSCEYADNYSNCEELKKLVTCDHPMVKANCGATCYCEGKIH